MKLRKFYAFAQAMSVKNNYAWKLSTFISLTALLIETWVLEGYRSHFMFIS